MIWDIQTFTFLIGLGGVAFTIYRTLQNPQIASDKKDALLAQRFDLQQAATERRFKDIQANFATLETQSQNHIQTVDTKVEVLTETVARMRNEIVKLQIIIEERIPKR